MSVVETPTLNADSHSAAGQGGAAPTDPSTLVVDYLMAMQARDLDKARAMLGAGFVMEFPGTGPMTEFQQLFDWAKDRYLNVQKTFEAVEPFEAGGVTVVYARGTLAGNWPDGSPFSGIRFIDRFEVRNGKIIRQDVWNDVSETRFGAGQATG